MLKKSNKDLAFDKISVNDLILFGIYSVLKGNEACTFDRLLKECFTLFPESFGFSRYPIWPDSRKLDRPLRLIRSEGLISGDSKVEFFITPIGENKALEIGKILRQGKLL